LSLSGLNNLKLVLKYYRPVGVLTVSGSCQTFEVTQTN
jgi:hypothetical protein